MITRGLSKESIELLETGIGYRNDLLYGSGIEDFEAVISHEILELGNRDIPLTCNKLYSISTSLMDIIPKKVIRRIVDYMRTHYKTSSLYVKWLCTKCNVIEYYEGCDENIVAYKIPSNALVISDLGREGALFISDHKWKIVTSKK